MALKEDKVILFLHKRYLLYIGLGLCVAVCGYWLVQSYYYLPHDFSNSYFGSYFFLRGEFDAEIFDPYTFNRRIYDAGFRDVYVSYNPNPPFTALFFFPFALLPLYTAKLIFNLVTFIWFIVCIYRLCRSKQVEPGLLLAVLPVLFFIPFRNQILFGQSYFLLFGLLVEGYMALERKNGWSSALFWGVAIFLKVFPAIIFLFLVIRKEWGAVVKLSLACAGLLAVSVIFQGVEVWKIYLMEVLPSNGRGEIGGAYVVSYQSALMFLKYAFYGDPQLNSGLVIDSPALYEITLLLFKSLILGFSVHLMRQSGSLLSFGFLLLTAMLLSPYGSTYTCILLIVLLIACYIEFRKYFIPIASIIFLIGNLPLSLFGSLSPVLQFPRLVLLLLLFATVIILSGARCNWRVFTVFTILFVVPAFARLRLPDDDSTFLETHERYGLVFDYGLEEGWLVCKYWYTDGENSYRTDVRSDRISGEGIELRDNQIFFRNRQLTHTPDRKRKPAALDDGRIIYLSDKCKGMGFYGLRVIDPDRLNNAGTNLHAR